MAEIPKDAAKAKPEAVAKPAPDQPAEGKGKAQKQKKPEKVLKAQDIIRFVETNLNGTRKTQDAICTIRGVGPMFANAAARIAGVWDKKFTTLSDDEQKRLEAVILHPDQHGIPAWMFNRRRDPATGQDVHLSASALDFTQKMDINEMKKMRSYKGVRHSFGLPVRGQRTRSSFRSGTSVGVKRKKEGARSTPGAAGAPAKK